MKRVVALLMIGMLLITGLAFAEDHLAAVQAPLESAAYEFNPHLYLPLLDRDVPQDWWDSFHNLCDALRAGETTFACSSEAAYKWATSPVTLTELFPPACTKITGESNDGTVPFENGIGRIYYQMPVDEYVARQAQFEALVADVLNGCLAPDDDDFAKCLKLYDYISINYTYQEDFMEFIPDGNVYYTIMTHSGQCIDLASVYAYFLLQAGVEALNVGCSNPDMAHGWTYIVLNGKGYHSDPTWGLRPAGDPLSLYYFMMDDARRVDSGCAVDDLTAPLLPRYWVSFSNVSFVAEDDTYCFPPESFLESLDTDSRTVRYMYYGQEHELCY